MQHYSATNADYDRRMTTAVKIGYFSSPDCYSTYSH